MNPGKFFNGLPLYGKNDLSLGQYFKSEKKGKTMRVEISGGKIKGWLKVSEAAFVCDISVTKMRNLVKTEFKDSEKFELYGTTFLRGTAVDKLAKKLEK